ncbi:MAG TPA: DUF1559 domain-containing protein, partial [Urbifossiella sp.]|nr:DUF1559 domain-containing protein [Urbifossiella sp.]
GCAGWFLPAVQRVREAAARAKCQCHIGCLARAVHGYHDVNGSFSATLPLPYVPPDRRLSWVVGLLPHMEQGSLFKRFDLTAPADAASNSDAAETVLPHLVCPSSDVLDRDAGGRDVPRTAVLQYVGVSGVGVDAAELEKGPRVGAFGYDRRTRIPDSFPDGLSSTLALVETAHDPGRWAHGGPATVRPFVSEATPHIGPGRPFGGNHAAELGWLWSSGAGMNVAMADGSQRFVRSTIDPAMLRALATAAGNDLMPKDWWSEASRAP